MNNSQTDELQDLADELGTGQGKEVVEAELGKLSDETTSVADTDDDDEEDDEDDDEEDGQAAPGRHLLNNEWVRTKELLARDEEVCKVIIEEAIDELKKNKGIDLRER